MSEAYTYAVLRYVHDVVTGEFVNVGVVLRAASAFKFRFRSTHGRVSSLFPSLDEAHFKEALNAIKDSAVRLEKSEGLPRPQDALSFAQSILVNDDGSFQWSEQGSGVTRDAEVTVERLYERLVRRHEKPSLRQRRNDADVWRPIRDKLEELRVADRFTEHTFRGSVDEMRAPHAWKNGHWHVISAFSLDMVDAEGVKDKAHRIRGHLDSVAEGLTEELALNLVVAPPANPQLMSAYGLARTILEKAALRPRVLGEDEAPALIERLAEEIREHDASQGERISEAR